MSTLEEKIKTAKQLTQEIEAKTQMLDALIQDMVHKDLKMDKDKPFKLYDIIEAARNSK